jgi:hypothetical protein
VNSERLQEQLTQLRLDWIRIQDGEIGDTTRYIFDAGMVDICFARREDETQPYTARDIRDILINCPPQRRIAKVHYSTQNTGLREAEIAGATEKRLAYIEALYALALKYKEALLAELVASEAPLPTLDETIRKRFDAAIEVLRGVDAQYPGMSLMSFAYISYANPENTLPGIQKEMWDWSLSRFIAHVIPMLQAGDISGLELYFSIFKRVDHDGRFGYRTVIGTTTPVGFYEDYRLTRFWHLVRELGQELQILAAQLRDFSEEGIWYAEILEKIAVYLFGQRLAAVDYLELCVLGPKNLDFIITESTETGSKFWTQWRGVTTFMGNVRASQLWVSNVPKPKASHHYELYRADEEFGGYVFYRSLQL